MSGAEDLARRGLETLLETVAGEAASLRLEHGRDTQVIVAGDETLAGQLEAPIDPELRVAQLAGPGWVCLVGARRPDFPSEVEGRAIALGEGWWIAAGGAQEHSPREVGKALHDLRNSLNAAHLQLTLATRRLGGPNPPDLAPIVERLQSVARHIAEAAHRVGKVEDLVNGGPDVTGPPARPQVSPPSTQPLSNTNGADGDQPQGPVDALRRR